MVGRPFRFVHASDLHLERVAQGIGEVPEHLRTLLLDAAYRAADRIVETVVAEDAQFLVLAGDVLDAQATGPRGPLFLVNRFQRLAERKIPVYWAGAKIDSPEHWPTWLHLPEIVHIFPSGRTEHVVHRSGGAAVARIVGMSSDPVLKFDPHQFEADPAGLFTIGVVHGEADAASLSSCGIHYWALGGSHARRTLCDAPCVAHYPGTTLGRSPREDGLHGCTLVQVDEQHGISTNTVAADDFRWCEEHLTIDEHTTRDGLESLFRERMHVLAEAAPGVTLLISWQVSGIGPLAGKLRAGPLTAELLAGLRSHFGHGTPPLWSLSITLEPAARLPDEWYEQETLLGDFLRALRHFQMNPDESLQLEEYLDERHRAGTLSAVAALSDPRVREHVLREVGMLGAELLRGEDAQP